MLVKASTKWLLGVFNVFKKNWECKVVGIIVKDSVETEHAVPSLVFLSITIEPQEMAGTFTSMRSWTENFDRGQ